MRKHLPDGLEHISRLLLQHGRQCFLVGGAVRDWLLGRQIDDYDLATDAPPEEVMRLFRRVIPTGLQHGTVTVLSGGRQFEVTTFRTEGAYTDHRRPENVSWTADIDEDLKRRDFTINAIAYDLSRHSLHDPFDGQADLKKKIIRAIGNPHDRLQEDALRILRAVRLAVQLDFTIEAGTLAAMGANAPLIVHVSIERVRDEFDKMLAARTPSRALGTLSDVGLLGLLLPELEACRGVAQPSLHCFDVLTHSFYACDGAPADNPVVRLAALFHDIGKPVTRDINEAGAPCFYTHEKAGADLARRILTRLRYPGQIVEKVSHLIRCHMFYYEESWSDAAVRRFVQRTGRENLADLFALRRADQFGLCRRPVDPVPLLLFERRIERVLEAAHALSLKDLAVNGEDVMMALELKEGKTIGVILDFLLESVLDDPALNDRERLLILARRYYAERLT